MITKGLNSAYYSNKSNLIGIFASMMIGPFVAFTALAWNFQTILIALAFMTVIAVVFFKRELGLYLVIFLLPIGENFVGFQPHCPWAESTDLFPLCPLIIIPSMAGILMRKIAGLEDANFVTQINFFVMTFLAWAFVSVLWAPNIYHTLFQLSILISNVIMFYLFVSNLRKSEATLRKVVKILIFCAVILAFLSVVSMHFLKKDHFGVYYLNKSLSLNYAVKHSDFRGKILATPNNTACFLNVGIAFSICLLLCLKERKKRFLVTLIIVFLVFGVLETKSKAGVGSLIILGMFFLVVYHVLRKQFTRNLLLYSAIIISLFILQNVNDPKEPRVIGSQEMSFSARMEIWGRGLHEFINRAPGWGLGIGGLRYYRDPMPHGHSIYFSTFFDFGLIGILLLIGMIIVLIFNAYRFIAYQNTYAQNMFVASVGSLLVVGVHGLVDFTYLDFTLWFVLGVATGTLLLVEEEGGRSRSVAIL
jgi:O-antigen ligase